MDIILLKKHKLVNKALPEGTIATVTNELGETLIKKKIAKKYISSAQKDFSNLANKVKEKLENKEKLKEEEEDKK